MRDEGRDGRQDARADEGVRNQPVDSGSDNASNYEESRNDGRAYGFRLRASHWLTLIGCNTANIYATRR